LGGIEALWVGLLERATKGAASFVEVEVVEEVKVVAARAERAKAFIS
jgi:hypothetical protein